jgi:hypothetical protein
MNDWLSFAVDTFGGGCALICLFEGTRRLAARGAGRNAVIMVALGAFYCLFYGGYFLWRYQELRADADTHYGQVYRGELPADWRQEMPGPRREAGSLALARSAFVQSGTLRTYFDAAGARKPFAPSQEDIRRRDRVVAAQTRVGELMRESFWSGLLWLAWGALAVLFGYGMSGAEKPLRDPPAPVTPG